MGRRSLTELLIWALCFCGTACGSAKVQGPQDSKVEKPSPAVVTLTHGRPNSSVAIKSIPGSVVDAEVLEIPITKVVNPSLTPIAIYVYLSDTEAGKSEPTRQLIGNFSLYPPDQPGKFLLNMKAFRNLLVSDANSKGRDLQLIFEMKRIDETKDWTPVEVSIGQPELRAAEK